MRTRPRNGGWSIHEHACHLAVVQPIMMARLDFILQEEHPLIKGYQPGRDEDPDQLLKLDLDASLTQFEQDRAAMVKRIRQLTPAEWQKPAVHDEYSDYGVAIMFRHLALHDYLHAYRMEQAHIELGF